MSFSQAPCAGEMANIYNPYELVEGPCAMMFGVDISDSFFKSIHLVVIREIDAK